MARLILSFRLIFLVLIISILLWIFQKTSELNKTKIDLYVSPDVHMIDPDDPSLNRNFSCIKTKRILGLFQTTLCLYPEDITINNDRIWKESQVTRIIKILIQYPDLYMIDIGAHIGSYTMFIVRSLRRFTLAVDCYLPNIERITRVVQLENA
jgi:hypothetical protein